MIFDDGLSTVQSNQSRTYFDAVTSHDHRVVFFNGTAEETRTWLEQNQGNWADYTVWHGSTLQGVTPQQYMGEVPK